MIVTEKDLDEFINALTKKTEEFKMRIEAIL